MKFSLYRTFVLPVIFTFFFAGFVTADDESYSIRHLKPLDSSEIVAYIRDGDAGKPRFVYLTRADYSESNKVTDAIAAEYASQFEFVYVYIPAGSMSAFLDVEPLTQEYDFNSLPVALMLEGAKLLSKADKINRRRDLPAYFQSRIQAVKAAKAAAAAVPR